MQTSQIFPVLLCTQFLPTARNPCTVWLPAAHAAIIISAYTKLSQQGLLKHVDFCVCTTYKGRLPKPTGDDKVRRPVEAWGCNHHPSCLNCTIPSSPAVLLQLLLGPQSGSWQPDGTSMAGSLSCVTLWGQRVGGRRLHTVPKSCTKTGYRIQHLLNATSTFVLSALILSCSITTQWFYCAEVDEGAQHMQAERDWALSKLNPAAEARGKLPVLCAPAHDALSYRE